MLWSAFRLAHIGLFSIGLLVTLATSLMENHPGSELGTYITCRAPVLKGDKIAVGNSIADSTETLQLGSLGQFPAVGRRSQRKNGNRMGLENGKTGTKLLSRHLEEEAKESEDTPSFFTNLALKITTSMFPKPVVTCMSQVEWHLESGLQIPVWIGKSPCSAPQDHLGSFSEDLMSRPHPTSIKSTFLGEEPGNRSFKKFPR